jgi:hypothetical protein
MAISFVIEDVVISFSAINSLLEMVEGNVHKYVLYQKVIISIEKSHTI